MNVSAGLFAEAEPLGDRIGPWIFWSFLVVLLVIIVWSFRRIARSNRPARAPRASRRAGARASVKTWTRPEDYAEHHRVVWAADPDRFTPTVEHWPLGVAALYGVCGDYPWDELAIRNLDDPREGLQEAWGIRSRPQLLSTLHWILREGHRVGFEDEVGMWSGLGEDLLKELVGTTELDVEQRWRLQQVRTDARGIREVDFEAWDLVRAAMLSRAGFSLGWLTKAETIDTLNLVSARLQHSYASWEQMGDHFLRARWFWGGNSGPESKQNDAHDASRQQALLDPVRGPWAKLPWSTPIPESRLLVVDALVAEDLTVQMPISSPTELAQAIDAATADRLADRA